MKSNELVSAKKIVNEGKGYLDQLRELYDQGDDGTSSRCQELRDKVNEKVKTFTALFKKVNKVCKGLDDLKQKVGQNGTSRKQVEKFIKFIKGEIDENNQGRFNLGYRRTMREAGTETIGQSDEEANQRFETTYNTISSFASIRSASIDRDSARSFFNMGREGPSDRSQTFDLVGFIVREAANEEEAGKLADAKKLVNWLLGKNQ